MELRVLRYYLAVVREQSISRAAESLRLTQPTLSRQLMELEEELGVKLLIRGRKNHSIALTEEGMLLKARAEEIVALADRTEAELTCHEREIAGDVYIGAGETDAMRLLAQAAKRLQDMYPHIRYHLFSGNAEDVSERLDKGLLDFGVLIGEADLSKYDYLPLGTVDVWGVLLRGDDPLAVEDSIRPKDLWSRPLILSQQSLRNNELSGWLGRSMERLNVAATYNLIYNAALLVEAGLGCAITIEKLVNTSGRPLCFRPLEPRLEGRLNIVWKKRHVFSKAAEVFLREMKEQEYLFQVKRGTAKGAGYLNRSRI